MKLFATPLPIAIALILLQLFAGVSPRPASVEEQGGVAWNEGDAPLAPFWGEGAVPMTETAVAIDPTDPERMVATQIVYGNPPQFCCSRGIWRVGWSTSDDGGASWTYRGLLPAIGHNGEPMQCDDPASFDPWVTFTSDGVAVLSYASTGAGIPSLNACGDSTLTVVRSEDAGVTWSTPVVVARSDTTCFADRDSIAADPVTGVLYVAWSGLGCEGDPIFLSRSTDGGLTWTAPVRVSLPDDLGPYGAAPQVSPDGSVQVAYYRAAELDGCVYIIGSGADGIHSAEAVIATSLDAGATWTHEVIGPVCDTEYQTHELPFSGGGEFSWPMFSIDEQTGFRAIAWLQRDHPFTTIHVYSQRDSAGAWNHTVLSEAQRGLLLPALAVAGDVARVAYVSMVSTGQFEVHYRESADGLAWTAPTTLTTGPSCTCWGQVNGPYVSTTDIGHYIGLDARAGRVAVTWPDDRDPTFVQTIFGRGGTYSVE